MNHTIDVLSAENLLETGSVPAAFILSLIPAAVIFFSRRFRGSTFLRRAAATLCALLGLFLCAGYLPAAQAQDTCTTWNDVNTWSGLYEAMQSDGCIRLTSYIDFTETAKPLQVPSGKTVTLDLNGNTINRGLAWAEAQEDGYVISVSGTLTLTGSGTITGGNNAGNGGGVYVASGGSLTMNSGISIEYNSAENGGGVYVDGGTFTLSGGTFTGNSASSNGGGVYVYSGSFYLSGGTISDNGVTSDNSHGGGVFIYDEGTYFYLSGNPTISENRKNGYASNIYLDGGKKITITGPLTNATPIGVGKDGSGFPITEGLSDYGTNANFKSDNSNYSINLNTAGEAEIVNRSTCTISFKNNGGTGTMASQTDLSVNHEVNLTEMIGLSNGALCFVGWNTMADGSGIYYADGATITPTGNTTLYAQWSQEYAAKISGGNSYPTLRAAINAAVSGQTVELLNNINSEEKAGGWPVTVASDKNFTLDLKGFSIDRRLTGQGARENGYVISVSGTLTLTGSGTITGGNNTQNGGGVYVATGGTFTMSGGTISGNTAKWEGGGVYVESEGTFNMSGGTISNNTAETMGGGVSLSSGASFTMSAGSTISGNTAQYGGGVYLTGTGTTFTMSGGTIGGTDTNAANTAGYGGGGVYVYDNATFAMSNGTISKNTAAYQGGGVYVSSESSFIMQGGTITGNTATSSSAGSGGGVYNGGTFEMTNGTISGNSARDGGGVYNGDSFTMKGGMIGGTDTNAANTAYNGGGVYNDGTFEMSGGTITGNKSSDGGGGVYYNGGSFTMKGGTITGNTAQYGFGGGVNVVSSGTFTMEDGTISGNTAASGGGVYVYRGTFNMTGGTIGGQDTNTGNTAATGGGVYISVGSTFTMEDGTISGNTSQMSGGGVYNDGTFNMEDGTISRNSARSGGGVYVESEGTFNMEDGTITGNTASTNGGGVYVYRGTVNVSGSPVISGNVKGGTISGGTPDNVFLASDQSITVTGQLSGSTIGVTMETPGKFTNSSTIANNDTGSFSSDDPLYGVAQYAEGENIGQLYLYKIITPVTVSGIGAADKIYDGNTTATLVYTKAVISGKAEGDDLSVTATGTFNDKNAGTGKTVTISSLTLTGNDADKYELASEGQQTETSASITPKQVTVSGIGAEDKTYDGTTTATLVYTKAVISGKIEGDDLSVTATGAFADASASASYKPVTISGLQLGRSDAGNYQLADSGQQETAEANIYYKAVTANVSVTEKPYDGSVTAAVTASVDTGIIGDSIEISGLTGTFDNANAGTDKIVTISDVNKSITGTGFENYDITIPGSVDNCVITKVPLTISAHNHTITYGEEPDNAGVTYGETDETSGQPKNSFVTGETESVLGGTLSYSYSYAQYGNIGSYEITPSGLTSDNYSITFNPGTLTVNPKEVAVSWGSTNLTFSGADQAPEASVAAGYPVNGDSCTVEVSGQQKDAGGPYTAAAAGLSNSNYTLPDVKPTIGFTIAKASGPVLDNITVSDIYTITSKTVDVSENIPQMPENAGDLSYTVKQVSAEGAVNASADIATDGKLTFSLQDGADGDSITAVVTVSSKNYENSDVNVVLELGPKEDAEVSFGEGNSLTVTWGDSLTLHPAAANEGTNGGWTLSSSEESVAAAADDGTVTILSAGETTITAEYDSDTSTGSAKLLLTVEPKSIAGAAVTLSETEFAYDETEKSVTVVSVVLADETLLTEGRDYAVSGDLSGTDAKAYTVTVTGKGNYTGSISAEWKIVKPGFTVTWLMDDGSELGTTTVEYGEMPSHDDPVKAADAQYTWSFDRWEPELEPVKDDTSYKAVFSSTVNQYTVTFVDEDGTTVLKEAVKYDYGTKAEAITRPEDPVKPATAEESFTFKGWEPEIADVTENVTYQAVYTGSSIPYYSVTFVDEDGTTVLKEAVKYASGTKAADITRPEDPVKPATAEESFTFKGWKPEIADVTEDAIYQAVYTNSTNSYTVTWKNADGTVLKTDEDVPYGTTPAYSGETPVKAPAGGYRYTFSAWKPEPGPVTGNAEYTASFADEKYIFSVTVSTEGQGTAYADPAAGEAGTKVTLSAVPAGGWLFREWQVVSGGVTIAADNSFTLGTEDAEIKAVFHDTPYTPLPADEDEPETTGNDQTYVIGSGEPRQFRIARVEENGNDSAYDRFEKALEQADASGGQVMGGICLLIDGQPLPPEKQPVLHQDYDYSRGSVIITLYPAYLDTLPVGEYTMEAFFEEDNGEIETFPTHLSVTEPRVVKFISIKNDGSYNTPKDIDAAEYKLTILITAGDKILRQAENVVLKVQPDEKEPKLSEEEVQFTVLGEDNTLEISADNRIVITGLPQEVIGYGPEVYDAASGTTERPVQHRYALSVREARFGRSGEILVYLLWDDGSRPVEEIRVVALPEDEIGAYQLRADGTKEYLLFQTYDICMAWLGSDELCAGPERCYHK